MIHDWINRSQQVKDMAVELVSHMEISVYVERATATNPTGSLGFGTEVPDGTVRKSINVRLDLSNIQGFDYVGMTTDSDVRRNDIWIYTNAGGVEERLRVAGFDKSTSNFTVARLIHEQI